MRLAWVLVLGCVGCGAPYHYVAHAEPNPFTRLGCRAVVEPVHAERLVVNDEPVLVWLREKSPESAASFDADVRASNIEFQREIYERNASLFLPGTPDNTFVIQPWFMHWTPGGVFGRAEANVVVDVLAPGDRHLLDRITIDTRAGELSSGARMRTSLRSAGKAAAAYVNDNWPCAAQ